jgi:hypothetical protein
MTGDDPNPLYDPVGETRLAHPSLETDAQLKADNTPDDRYQRKVTESETRQLSGVTARHRFTIYNSTDAPIPIIRNEELILLRAEANLALGNRDEALADINLIRTVSGGLPALAADPGSPDLLDELLYNKRYSLVYEGGHRWVDLRRYDRLATLPRDLPEHKIFRYMPLPQDACTSRTPEPAGCAILNGF